MKYRNPDIESSYHENDLGKTLYDFVMEHKPLRIVEIGTLYGYSTVAMGMALDELGAGHITAYDLFEDYQYKHSTLEKTQANIDAYGVGSYVTLIKKGFEEWLAAPEPFDLLHFDISNTGDAIERLYAATKEQREKGAIVLFEGGSPERDEVEWVKKYNKRPIGHSGVPYTVIDARFPSLSMLGNPI